MRYTTLGTAGPTVSAIAFGNSLTHGNQIADNTAIACVHAALDAGITLFDTADVYGNGRAEELLGAAVRNRRDEVLLCTKVGRTPVPESPRGTLEPQHILQSAEASLRRLDTDRIDIYQAHRFDETIPLSATMQAFAELFTAGKIRYLGISEWTTEQLTETAHIAAEIGIPLITNQIQYSMLWRVPEREIMPVAKAAGIGLLAWSPLAGGVLTGKYRPGRPLPAGSRVHAAAGGEKSVARWNFLHESTLNAVAALDPIAQAKGITVAQLALAWVLDNPAIGATIIGASRPGQLHDNLRAIDVVIDDVTREAIDNALAPVIQRDPELVGKLPARI